MPLIIKYLIVYALSAFKIILGPTIGLAYGFTVFETAVLSLGGMMTTVYLLSYFGPEIRRLFQRVFGPKKPRKKFTRKTRNFVKIWQRYGVPGVAFFTPILLSPPGGTILATAFGGKRSEIIKWMWVFGAIWAFILTLLVKYASDVLQDLGVL
ncbi:hypothetical protein [Marinoscillum furvescens]|uniref:Small multi-drug export protein n=1 Tax=Marinoscillum furvescens DSM 4134 TaxID=1122208 RepID=A0A3D9L5T1_MARFU|nr:hypothetical protein [Marinoscillum furvescens]RED99782.1 hypothetical protein C7460_10764 [Marinoscillum furvescens DSM 4134]